MDVNRESTLVSLRTNFSHSVKYDVNDALQRERHIQKHDTIHHAHPH